MKKTLMVGAFFLGLSASVMASSPYDKCSRMTYVTQMELKGNRITKNDIPLLETLLRMGRMGDFALEIRHGAKSKPQAILVSSWLKDHGFDWVSIKEDGEVTSGVYLYAGSGCGFSTYRTESSVNQRNVSNVSAKMPNEQVGGSRNDQGAITNVYKWDEGERLSTVVMRWTGRNVSPVMDATIRRGGQFNVGRPEEAVERLSRATGCAIQLSHDPIVVDCSGQHQGAK